jgi:putative transposase
MNKIELEWQQFKKHEISGQMFEDEIHLAYTVIHGIDARGE